MRQFREFDCNAESESAPVECRHAGYTPHVLLREGGQLFGVVRWPDGRQRAMEWNDKGKAHWHNNDIDLVMAPIDWVQGRAVFQGDIVYRSRRKVAVNARQMGDAPPWAGATLEPVEPQAQNRFTEIKREALAIGAEHFLAGRPILTEAPAAQPEWRERLDKLVAAINAVAESAPRIQLEQAAAAMQQEAVRQLLAEGKALGWIGREIAAGIVRRLDVDQVVNKMLGVQS